MKRNRFGMKRVTAVLLCVMLVLGSAGTSAYAGEPVQDGTEDAFDTGELVPAAEDASEEDAAEQNDLGEDASEEDVSEEDASGEDASKENASEEKDPGENNADPAEDASQGQDEQPAAAEGADEKPVEESGEAASEESGAQIEEPLSEDEAAATDNAAALESTAVSSVTYVERSWDGTKVVSTGKTRNEVSTVPSDGSMTGGWYYLGSDVTVDGRIKTITGDVNLILGDGFTLDVKGLYVPQGTTLTVYAQSNGDGAGRICSHPGKSQGGAGIGGYSGHDNGNIVIHGGTIEAEGYDHCAGIGSNDGREGGSFTIYGGTVTAKGGSDGAGIGGGRNCDGGTITIYGGTVNANDENCNENGAGIGGGKLKIIFDLRNEFGSKTKAHAIGRGSYDFCDGTVYIAHDNNGTGKYLRVDYGDDSGKWKTAKASDRTDKCHETNIIEVTECNHKSRDGENGLTYKIDGDQHRKQCKYCGLDVTEAHSGSDCECGYKSGTCTVGLSDESGVHTFTVARGKEFEFPDDDGQVMFGNTNPPNIYRVKGWMPDSNTSGGSDELD